MKKTPFVFIEEILENINTASNGRIDGRKNFPESKNDEVHFIEKKKSKYERKKKKLEQEWISLNNSLQERWSNAIIEGKKNHKDIQKTSHEYNKAKEKYFEAHPEEKSLPANLHKKFRLYYIFLVVYSFADLYLFTVTFRIFKEAEILNWALGLVVGAILAFLCHKIGKFLHEESLKYKIFAWFGIFFIILISIIAAIIRKSYLNLANNVKGIDSDTMIYMFVGLSLFFAFAAIFYSYYMHRPGQYEIFKYEKELSLLEKKEMYLAQVVTNVKVEQKKVYNIYKAEFQRLNERVNYLISLYFQENVRKRKTRLEGNLSSHKNSTIPETFFLEEWTLNVNESEV